VQCLCVSGFVRRGIYSTVSKICRHRRTSHCECEEIDRTLDRRTIHLDENYPKLSEGRTEEWTELAGGAAHLDGTAYPITGRPLPLNLETPVTSASN